MSPNGNRADRRFNVRVPVRFRTLNDRDSVEQRGESENISQGGIFLATEVPLNVGEVVEVSLGMPQEVSSRTASGLKCVARVVHVQRNSSPGGRIGVGLHIEGYQVQPGRERWAHQASS
jgi:hypothetical protein